ncbi:MAG: phosphotransferase family protein [Rhodospirillaceae bacterium]|nr:phosphotransferase family protein [Rhodospirillaceae bacterium]
MHLVSFIRDVAGADTVTIEDGDLLTGGAIQENRALTVTIQGGEFDGSHYLVLRTAAKAAIAESRPLEQQFALLKAAEAAGVTIPKPLWHCSDASVTGKPFYLMARIPGTALGNQITRIGAQPALAETLAKELTRIHSIRPPLPDLDFLGAIRLTPAMDAIATYRAYLDEMPEPHPVLEWTLRWLETNAPPIGETVLCHRDFRTGNYMVDDGVLTGVLDWEFAGWGDPHEDIAWFCARCWRFAGARLEAGGIAARDIFYRAYEQACGRVIDPKLVHYWETMAHVRWAVIAIQQAMRHRSGDEPSLELALIGRRLAEIEYECLNLTGALT